MAIRGTLFIISAPSGAGKTSLVSALVTQDPQLRISVSHTTRAPRTAEVHSQNYYFIDLPTFNQLKAEQAFLEYAQVFGHWYGTTQAWVENQLNAGFDVILEIDWQGARRVREMLSCVNIFILPPSRAALEARLQNRAQDPPQVIVRRMQQASVEISHYHEYDYVVVNDVFEQAL